MTSQHGAFWDDLARDLEDPEFARQYAIESARISTVDAVVNSLDKARATQGLSKAELARAIGSEPATIRRLFGRGHVNPTLGTLAEVAAALGFEIVVRKAPTEKKPPLGGKRMAVLTSTRAKSARSTVSGGGRGRATTAMPVAAKAERSAGRPAQMDVH